MSLTNPDAGLQRDANTVALYKSIREFNPPLGIGIHESADGQFADACGNYPLVSTGTVRVSNGPLGVAGALADPPQFSRAFCSTLSDYIQGVSPIDQAYNDAIRAGFTQQFVYNHQWVHTSQRGIYGANNTPAGGALRDWLARISTNAAGGLEAFWESNDTNFQYTTTGLVLPIDEWLVITVRWIASTGYQVIFDVHRLNGGSLQSVHNQSFGPGGVLPVAASGVGSSRIVYGRTETSNTGGPQIGQIAFGRIYKGILTDQQVAAQAQELLTTGTLASVGLGNDLHRHEFNEPPDWIDEGDYGLHCNSGGVVDYDPGKRHIDIVGSGGRARRSTAQAQRIGSLQADKRLETAFGFDRLASLFSDTWKPVPEYSMQWVCLWRDAGSPIIAYWEASSESLATNYLLQFNWGSGGNIGWFAERGNGVNIGAVNVVSAGPQGRDRLEQSMLLTVRVGEKPGSPGTMRVRMSVNDQLDVASFDATGVPQGGTAGNGLQWGGPSEGYLQEYKLSVGEITDQQIIDDFARLLDIEGSGDPVDETAPIITNLTPPASTLIYRDDLISFDIIDPDSGGLFTNVMVFVSYPDGSTDVIHDGDGFRGPFVGSPNSRSVIASGFRYVVRPSGGWPATPTIEFIAIDQGGNLGQVS